MEENIIPEKIDEKKEIETYKYKTIQVDGINGWLLAFFPCYSNGDFGYVTSIKTKDLWRLHEKLLKTPLLMKSDNEGETPMIIYSGF